MTTIESSEIIESFPIFDESLASFLHEHGETKIFSNGEIMMKPGQFFKYAMLIVDGRVKLYREGDEGEEFFMYYLENGDACALSMLCMARNQSSTIMAVATEDTEVIMIPIQYIDMLMKNHPSWYHFVVETYRSRFEELLVVLDQIAFKNMDERLTWYLKRQAKTIGQTMFLTHQQVANDLNSSREVISRLLKKLEKTGIISMERNTIQWLG